MNVKAFPSAANDQTKGVDLRDWFAGQAIAAFIAGSFNMHDRGEDLLDESIALECYQIADAMLAARKKES